MDDQRFLGRFRSRLFVNPGLQLRVTVWFVCVALLALVFQFLQFTTALLDTSRAPLDDSSEALHRLADDALATLLHASALALPLTLGVGLIATFRVAGPAHRMTDYLRRVRAGEPLPDCTLRKGDEFGELCELVNDVTREQRDRARALRTHDDAERAAA